MNKKSTATLRRLGVKKIISSSIVVIAAALMVLNAPMSAFADRFDEQINQLNNEISGYQAEAGRLRAEADTLQNAVNALNAQKNAIQAQIALNEAKHAKLQEDITVNQAKLDKQETFLGDVLADLYVESSITPLEMMASSNSISEFIDKQEYYSAVRDSIQDAITEVKRLQAELKQQKKEVEQVLADQKAQREQLAAKEREQADLLAATQGQEAAYQSLISDRNGQVAALRAEQAAANARLGGRAVAGDPNKGGYPAVWANAPQDSLVDNWGMYNRECVSYTAWKVYQTKGYMPYWGGRGNANQWPSSARADGIATGYTPRKHSVAISMSGYYGHAMWVEDVYSNGYIRVSQYNYDLAGNYSEMTLSSSGLTYIYF